VREVERAVEREVERPVKADCNDSDLVVRHPLDSGVECAVKADCKDVDLAALQPLVAVATSTLSQRGEVDVPLYGQVPKRPRPLCAAAVVASPGIRTHGTQPCLQRAASTWWISWVCARWQPQRTYIDMTTNRQGH
jgi:hypothetical protein